jgi:hypothetical protein
MSPVFLDYTKMQSKGPEKRRCEGDKRKIELCDNRRPEEVNERPERDDGTKLLPVLT